MGLDEFSSKIFDLSRWNKIKNHYKPPIDLYYILSSLKNLWNYILIRFIQIKLNGFFYACCAFSDMNILFKHRFSVYVERKTYTKELQS